MSIKRRLAILASAGTVAVTTLLVGSQAALAAPTTGIEFAVDCEGLGEFTVVGAPSEAVFAPVFIPGTHHVLVPYSVSGVATVGEVSEPFEAVKAAPVPADAITCAFEATFTEGDVTITLTGTAVVVQRGAPQ
ncbi:MAG: hypothetical protein ICV70_05810 [Jiangellaceae bacterium]|nr:hypothetical protein [Jiangellaceae bacterium]